MVAAVVSLDGVLMWTGEGPPLEELDARGAEVVNWKQWRAQAASWLRSAGPERRSFDPPARAALEPFLDRKAVAVLGVRLSDVEDVRCLHETLLVPVLRAGIPLLVECAQAPEELDADRFVEPAFEHPYTLERTRWLCAKAIAGDVRHPAASAHASHRPLDDAQLDAARA